MSHVGYGMALSFMASQKNYNACCKFCQKCPGWKGDHGLCTVCNVRWDPHTTCSCEKSVKIFSQLFDMFKKWIYFWLLVWFVLFLLTNYKKDYEILFIIYKMFLIL
jgi:hypothetical protein